MSPPCDILVSFPDTSGPHCTSVPLNVRVHLVIHREVILERFHLTLYGTSRLVCGQSKKTTEQELTKTTYDVLEGDPVIFESGTLKYDVQFIFPENKLLVPSQHVLLPDGSLSQFSYFVKAECTTLKGLELKAIKTLELKPSLQGLRLYTDFVTTTEIEPHPLRQLEIFSRRFFIQEGRSEEKFLAVKVPFRLEFAYKRRYPDQNFGNTNNVFYQNERLGDFVELYLYTPLSNAVLMKLCHEASWWKRKTTTPLLRILINGVSLRQVFVKNAVYKEDCTSITPLLEQETQMAVRLDEFEEVKRSHSWDNVRPEEYITDKEYRFKFPSLLMPYSLATDAQSYFDELVSLHFSLKLQIGVSFLPTLPDQLIELESRILLLPQDLTRLEEIAREKTRRIFAFEKSEKLPTYLSSGRDQMVAPWNELAEAV
ncbi:hypothetical protein C7M61_003744 [Candidozyma pseudohaemuli]|uniref:Uncharacterized protein n=1 Tax=Candidozyma pseudohaemuli TaxID=418784 RepID=A0A2P7YLM8_9ASCO|nr:hypothetical protein C7M61_003744 [[Candida] pseudohaemulonii]PSK36880.1 hypothetical protein C7M61_003744 [[Candida] pseudohaemulonii]